jgi:hypothetical protein
LTIHFEGRHRLVAKIHYYARPIVVVAYSDFPDRISIHLDVGRHLSDPCGVDVHYQAIRRLHDKRSVLPDESFKLEHNLPNVW